jgi:hypothetical protein
MYVPLAGKIGRGNAEPMKYLKARRNAIIGMDIRPNALCVGLVVNLDLSLL